ncbi:hypothetical protein J4E89_000982 [Alternaria sp. Ai002NY15]|nr:hypothetical protein J4E89_000982 [Alternaria sp. Ai002NY15]
MVRQAARPKPDMSYSNYIASKTRLARLEADDMQNYAAMSYAELREEMKSLGMFQGGKKQRMVTVLERQFREMRMEHTSQAKRRLREHPEMMLASEFKRDPSVISFTDLPGEVRNMIYDLALFEPPSGDFAQAGNWEMTANSDHIFLSRSRTYSLELDLAELRCDRTISALHVVGALDKQIRKEVQTFFWAQIHITIVLENYDPQDYCSVVHRFLEKIGPLGRSALAGLTVQGVYEVYQQPQHQEYQTMIASLRECRNLRTLNMCLPMHMVMGPQDRKAMEQFFLHGQPLVSPSVDALVGALHSIPQLRCVRLCAESNEDLEYYLGRDDFTIFALTGAREGRLVQEVRRHLQARTDVEYEVVGNIDQVESYDEWLTRKAG